jgi:hypothetical protein
MKVRNTNQSATEQRTTVKKRRKKLLDHLEGIINVGNLAQFNFTPPSMPGRDDLFLSYYFSLYNATCRL